MQKDNGAAVEDFKNEQEVEDKRVVKADQDKVADRA